MKFKKPRFWHKKYLNLFSLLLLPLSLLIQVYSTIRSKIIITKKFNSKVICVGNLYLGGTGKTPLTIKLFEILKYIKKNPTIIKKYYKNQIDEIELIQNKVGKVFTSKSRQKAIMMAENDNFDTMILDDGSQDYSIFKDLNIACFNSKQLIGNGHTIPSGPLRENFSSIKKFNIIIINGDKNQKFENKVKKIAPNINIFYSEYYPVDTSKYANKDFLAFAGIGNPDSFFELMENNKLNIKEKVAYPDHYNFSQKDIKHLFEIAHNKKLDLITTEKDYYRLKKMGLNNIDFFAIKLKIHNEQEFIKRIKECI